MTSRTDDAAPVAAIVLAAGKGTRFAAAADGAFKLLALIDGVPLVRRVVDAASRSTACEIVVVTGHRGEAVMSALSGITVREVRNAHYAEGLSTSLRAGVAALHDDVAGVVVMLADMPHVSAAVVDALIVAFRQRPDASAIVPIYRGQSGNPVLLARALFPAVESLAGDQGARRLLRETIDVIGVVIDDDAVTFDVDTPDALAGLWPP